MEVYDRQRDIFPYTCIDKSAYFDVAPYFIFVVYDYIDNRWIYELFDQNDWDLLAFYDKGRVHGTSLSGDYSPEEVMDFIAERYPEADIEYIPSFDRWLVEYFMP